jgi:hypothetical protein
MNVLIVLKHGRVSGVNTFARALSIGLKKLGYKVYFNVITEHTRYYNYITEHGYGFYKPGLSIDLCIHNYNSIFQKYARRARLNYFVTHGTQCEEYTPPQEADKVLCLSGQQFDFYKHKNKSRLPNIIEQRSDLMPIPPRIKLRKVLLCDLRYGHFYQDKIKEACGYLGVKFDFIGKDDTHTDMLTRMNEYDLIIGYGRCVIEALSIGKCVIVYGFNGGDGYMSKNDFENFEYKNFSGYSKKSMPPPPRMEPLDFYTELIKYNYLDGVELMDLVVSKYAISDEIDVLNEFVYGNN